MNLLIFTHSDQSLMGPGEFKFKITTHLLPFLGAPLDQPQENLPIIKNKMDLSGTRCLKGRKMLIH